MTTPADQWIRTEITGAVSDLLKVHWSELVRALDDSGNETTIAFSVKVNCQQERPVVGTRISFAIKFSDERESIMSDHDQMKLDLNKDVTMTMTAQPADF